MNIVLNHPFNLFSAFGLVLDFIGVLLLFKYGLPSKVKAPVQLLDTGNLTKKEIDDINILNTVIKKRAYWGLALISVGFLLQFLGVRFKTM